MKKKRGKRDKPIILYDKEFWKQLLLLSHWSELSHGAIYHSKGGWETEYVGSCGQLEVGFHYHGRKRADERGSQQFLPFPGSGARTGKQTASLPTVASALPPRQGKWAVSSAHTADLQEAGSRAPEDKGDPLPHLHTLRHSSR